MLYFDNFGAEQVYFEPMFCGQRSDLWAAFSSWCCDQQWPRGNWEQTCGATAPLELSAELQSGAAILIVKKFFENFSSLQKSMTLYGIPPFESIFLQKDFLTSSIPRKNLFIYKTLECLLSYSRSLLFRVNILVYREGFFKSLPNKYSQYRIANIVTQSWGFLKEKSYSSIFDFQIGSQAGI